MTIQILFRDLLRAPVGADARELAHHQAFDIRLVGFVVVRIGAVIADFGIGQDDDLAGVGRISKDLLIAGDGGVENDLPEALALRAIAFAAEDASILQRQDCLHCFSGEWIL